MASRRHSWVVGTLSCNSRPLKMEEVRSSRKNQTNDQQQVTLLWSNINVRLNQGSAATADSRFLLQDVSGIAKPGELMAILGGSGAGKSTLLSLLSGRLSSDTASSQETGQNGSMTIGGSIFLNACPVERRTEVLRRLVAFVEQDDVFPGFLTVFEHLWFNAKLRMTNASVTDEERRRRVDALLAELNLTLVSGTLIGYQQLGMKTLSGGERKRLSVATELISNAPLLFLDEPTTGLDSFTSKSVMMSLYNLAQTGRTVIFTIHQPSSELFATFDRICLLSEGKVCFTGNREDAADFFAAEPISRPCPQEYNPADFYLDVLSRPQLVQQSEATEIDQFSRFLNKAFVQSSYGQALTEEIKTIFSKKPPVNCLDEVQSTLSPKPSNLTQLRWTSWRAAKSFYRTPQWIRVRVIAVIAYSLFFGIVYFNLGTTPADVMNRSGLAYELIVINCMDNLDVYANSIPLERGFLLRENQAGLYSLAAYFFGRQFVELPLLLVFCVVITTVVCLMSNFWSTVTATGIVFMQLAVFLSAVVASSFGYVVGFMSDNMAVVIAFRRIFLTLLGICNGYYLNVAMVPAYLKWLVYISVFFYGNEAVSIAEWENVEELECPETDGIDNTSQCFPNGRAVLDYYSFGDCSSMTIDLAALVALIIAWRSLALFLLYYRSYGSYWKSILREKVNKRRTQ